MSADSQLDALIAKIHGLSNTVADPVQPPRNAAQPPRNPVQPPRTTAPAASGVPAQADASGPVLASLQAKLQGIVIDEQRGGAAVGNPAGVPAASAVALQTSPPPASSPASAVQEMGESTLEMAHGFQPSRDEPWRPQEPDSLYKVGVNESAIEQLILRYLLARGEQAGRQIAEQVKLPFRIVEPILDRLKMEQKLAYRTGTAAGDYVYVLTEFGRGVARGAAADCTYYGACPVPLADYIASVKLQSVESQKPKQSELLQAFKDLLINPRMLDRLGPAVNSGRGMFLYGFPGNGKTSIAERVTSAFGKYIWIPRAIDVDGEVMRLFDRMNHEDCTPQHDGGWLDQCAFDKRWVRILRPTIVAGGELTMDMLEVQGNAETGISESPLQMKSNCGTLVIDDFGRQKMSVDQLLNRWIVPLEKRFDFLNMRSGKKIQVPFDQLVVFSTNLEPKDLVDDAFLRRIPYKIEVMDPPEQDFRKLFEIMCKVLKIPYQAEPIEYLIERHYKPVKRPFRNCQPRDLLLQVRNYCLYHDRPVELRNEYFDYAVENYFSIM